MNPEILQEFIDETRNSLLEICRGITAYYQNADEREVLEKALRYVEKVKEAALKIEFFEIVKISRAVESELKEIVSAQCAITPSQNKSLFERISTLEYMLSLADQKSGEIYSYDKELNEGFLSDSEFEKLLQEENSDKAETFNFVSGEQNDSDPAVEEEFEIDAEMLEIFTLEAEDLLRNISTHLALLETKPDNIDALLEIRRNAHTLKGSAGITGFKKISALAHRIEDLLDYISENNIAGNKSVFELLMAATDCLEALTGGQTSAELDRKITELNKSFDEITRSLQNPEIAEKETLSVSETAGQLDFIEEAKEVQPENDSAAEAEANENQAQAVNLQNRSVVRVSLERLDHLFKLVSEMIVSRSVFERRIVEFEEQIQELIQTTNRLRRSTGKLETDFEAGTLENRHLGLQSFGRNLREENPFFANKPQEFDSLEFDRYTEFHQTTRELAETTGDVSAIHNEFDNILSGFGSLFDTQKRLVEEMQESLMRLRMVPLNSLAARLHRTVRVTANEEKKKAELDIQNGEIEIDTQILDAFAEPLLHLLRNAVAHGIEPSEVRKRLGKPEKGRIVLRAYSEGTHVVFVVSDDGQGISTFSLKEKAVSAGFITQKEANETTDEEAFSLVFLPGLSTASAINQISGRGVGMNIVKSGITRRHGTISIKSEPQKGTSFTVRLPMSLAVTRTLMVKANEQTFGFPLKIVRQIIEISAAELKRIAAENTLRLNDLSYKFFNFNDLINFPSRAKLAGDKISILLIETSETPYALAVDQILRPEETVIKPLGSLLQNASELIGATILGDGSVVPVLDLIHLIEKKEKSKPAKQEIQTVEPKELSAPKASSVLIVDDSPSVRHINSNLISNAGWQPLLAKDGLEALEVLQTARELPCAVVTDVEMPRMDGYELLAAIKRQEYLRAIPVIIITSRSGDKHRQKAYNLGVSAYLNKPFEESDLIEKIRQLTN